MAEMRGGDAEQLKPRKHLETEHCEDGRAAYTMIREMKCSFALLDRPDGSASFSFGNTSVMAAVYGPREVAISKELHDRSTVEIVWHAVENDNTTSLQAHLMEFVVNASAMIHEFPRSCIRVVIQEIQNDGSVLACAVNATCLALMDAGVPLTSLFTAASCAIVDDNIMIDPSMREVKAAGSVFTVGYKQPSNVDDDEDDGEIVLTQVIGALSVDQTKAALNVLGKAAKSVAAFIRKAKSH
eukprot:gene9870-2061_t